MKMKKGLTLVEVLGVIIILGIIASITFVVYNKLFPKSELASGQIQASTVQDQVAKYMADNNGDLPTKIPNADYIEKPALVDEAKVSQNLKGSLKGNYYIYGPSKTVSYDLPEKFIKKVYDAYTGDKSELVVEGTPYIDTEQLYVENLIPHKPFTKYMLESNGNIIQVADESIDIETVGDGENKPTKPIIIPSKSSPYYNNEIITFEATSYSSKPPIRYEWTGLENDNQYAVGTHAIGVVAIDAEGNRSDTSTFNLPIFDSSTINMPPTAPVVNWNPKTKTNIEEETFTSGQTITLTASSTDPEGGTITYEWIGKKINNRYTRGKHEISVYAIDNVGNVSTKTTLTLNVLNGPPIINGVTINPNPAHVFDKVGFVVDAYDPDGDYIQYKFEKGDNLTPAENFTLTKDQKFNKINDSTFPVYKMKVIATDSMGASSERPFTFVITNRNPTAPTLTMTPHQSTDIRSYTRLSFQAFGGTDPDEPSENLTYEFFNRRDYYPVGTHTVRARTWDSNEGYSPWTDITFTVNNTPPNPPTTITMTHANPLYADTDITWGVSGGSDLDGIAPSPDNDYVVYEWNNKYTRYIKGTHTIRARSVDKHGAVSTWLPRTFTVVNKPPTTPIISMVPGPTSDLRADTRITWGATSTDVDIADTLTYQWIGKQDYYIKGNHTVQVRANDGDGGLSPYQSINFTVNNTKPTRPNIYMTPNASTTIYATTNLTFTANGSSDIDVADSITYQWSRDGGAWTTTAPNGTYVRGTHTVRVRTVDTDGAASDINSITFTVVNSNPSMPNMSMNPSQSSTIYADTPITWSVSGSTDVDGDTITYEWLNKNTYYVRGEHTVQVRASDGQGGYSGYRSITFTVVNKAPTSPGVSASLGSCESCSHSFSRGTSSDVDNDTLTYYWQSDSGAWSTSVPNGYYSSGSHTVSVKANDGQGGESTVSTVRFTWRSPYYETVVDTPGYYKQVVDVAAHEETVVDKAGYFKNVVDVEGHWERVQTGTETWCAGYSSTGVYYEHAGSCSHSHTGEGADRGEYQKPVYSAKWVGTTYKQEWVEPTYKKVWVEATYKDEWVPTTYKDVLRSGYWYTY